MSARRQRIRSNAGPAVGASGSAGRRHGLRWAAALGAAIALGVFVRWFITLPDEADRKVCAWHLHQVGVGLRLYGTDYSSEFPPDMKTLTEHEVVGLQYLKCPAPRARKEAERAAGVAYAYSPGGASSGRSDVPVVWEALGNHETPGAGVLFADWTVRWCNPEEFNAAMSRLSAAKNATTLPGRLGGSAETREATHRAGEPPRAGRE